MAGYDLIPGPSLAERTFLRLGGRALAEVRVRDEDGLSALPGLAREWGGELFFLGRGSNLLAPDRDLPLVLVRVGRAAPLAVISQTKASAVIRAGAGMSLPGFLSRLPGLGLSGLEGLCGIPGTLGGAVAMNAGSFGVQAGDFVRRVRLWTPDQGLFRREAEKCRFGYRRFDPGTGSPALVWEVEFELPRRDPAKVREDMRLNYAKKKATQPVLAHTCGCVFKNPPGESAGRLLDQAGFRGKTLGGMAFSRMHANFLVNLGRGTSAQALELIQAGRAAVSEKFGIGLETEVVILT